MAEPERRPPARPLTLAEQVEVLKADVARLAAELESARHERYLFAVALNKHEHVVLGDTLRARELADLPASKIVIMTVGGLRKFCREMFTEAERKSHA